MIWAAKTHVFMFVLALAACTSVLEDTNRWPI